MTAVDTNVLLDIVDGTQAEATAAIALLAGAVPPLVISPAVFSELCAHRDWQLPDVRNFLLNAGIVVAWELSEAIWAAAGESFARHAERRRRSRNDRPRRIATDFIIGAHADSLGALVTRDDAFFRRNFPSLRIVGASVR